MVVGLREICGPRASAARHRRGAAAQRSRARGRKGIRIKALISFESGLRNRRITGRNRRIGSSLRHRLAPGFAFQGRVPHMSSWYVLIKTLPRRARSRPDFHYSTVTGPSARSPATPAHALAGGIGDGSSWVERRHSRCRATPQCRVEHRVEHRHEVRWCDGEAKLQQRLQSTISHRWFTYSARLPAQPESLGARKNRPPDLNRGHVGSTSIGTTAASVRGFTRENSSPVRYGVTTRGPVAFVPASARRRRLGRPIGRRAMPERLEHQRKLMADRKKIIATADVGDSSPEDVRHDQGLSSCDRAAPRDGGDDRVTFFLAPGQWPRVFPGL
jgi:hypothetical protein